MNTKLSELQYTQQKNKIFKGLFNVVIKLNKQIKIINTPLIISDDDNIFYIYFLTYDLYKEFDVCEVRLLYRDSYSNIHIIDPPVIDINKYYERVINKLINTASDLPQVCDICYETNKINFGCNICSSSVCCTCYMKNYINNIENNKKYKCVICRYE